MTINPNEYKFISDSLGEASSVGVDIANSVGSILNTLKANELDESNTDKQILLGALAGSYSFMIRKHIRVSPQLRDIVLALQEHILHRYNSVDDFLLEKGILVTQAFADISRQMGYEIDPTNIE